MTTQLNSDLTVCNCNFVLNVIQCADLTVFFFVLRLHALVPSRCFGAETRQPVAQNTQYSIKACNDQEANGTEDGGFPRRRFTVVVCYAEDI